MNGIKIMVNWNDDQRSVTLTNNNGDTYSSRSEELQNFLMLSKEPATAVPEKTLRYFEDLALTEYCRHSEVEGFIFTTYQGRSSKEKSNGYCAGFQNGYKQALIDQFKAPVKVVTDEEIKNYLISYYSDRPEVQNLHLASIRAIQWYRKQLTGE